MRILAVRQDNNGDVHAARPRDPRARRARFGDARLRSGGAKVPRACCPGWAGWS